MKDRDVGNPGQEGLVHSPDSDSWFNRVPIPGEAAAQVDKMLDKALTEVFGAPSEIGQKPREKIDPKDPKPNDSKLSPTDRIPTPEQRNKPPFV